jgi:drug/metabolite transporter (DMT)-like permease
MIFSDWILLVAGVVLSSLGSIFLKLGATHVDHSSGLITAVTQALTQWRLYFGAFCYFIPVVIWIYMLKRIDITYLQPLFALIYVTTPLLAIPMLQETISGARWAGIAVILIGIVIVART